MNTIVPFDTETTGIPDWKIPSDDPKQPHIVQLAAVVVDVDTRNIIQTVDVVIRPAEGPAGWVISQEMTDIHGISHEYAMDVGIPEYVAADMMMALAEGRTRVAFNTTFDNRIIRIALKRYFSETTANEWKAGSYECAMIAAKKVMGGKRPKLVDAYKYFTGLELEDAHSAYADTLAAMEVYFACKDPARDNVPAAPVKDTPKAPTPGTGSFDDF